MHLTRVMLGVAWVPFLSGCMAMGGLGHVGDPGAHPGHEEARQAPVQMQHAEATNEGLTIALSFSRPISGVAAAIDAQLRSDGVLGELTDVTMRLRIQAPSGNVEVLPMQPLPLSAAGTHRVQYVFPSAGVYLLTAEGQVGTAGVARTVSVTTVAEVGSGAFGVRHHWHAPAVLLSGLGMVAMMALMMAGSGS